ncbi:carboxylesterase/lipase family protein [Martelella soudanensis]|uniref:carboxylesterase/lipase family protein n=1 Tax=unclassified Martelella TaxID=2629616 RepID=UPI0015DFAD14|nr:MULTISPECIES: carboxylesterase family protein [unclassified Martelella]
MTQNFNFQNENDKVVADCPSGSLCGNAAGDIAIFKGIPYALPPTKNARWRPPSPVRGWTGVRDATQFGPASVQPPRWPRSIFASELPGECEDCLSLNIWAPKNASNAPVIVWIHGGSLVWGSSSEKIYDGEKLAGRGIVVVSINYRLGILGFLAHPQLSAESESGVSGNYGLLDQMEALRWIKRNISSFGGDPANITVMGESAGALSVMYLLASPLARGLFDKAIVQSGYMLSTPHLNEDRFGTKSAEDMGEEFCARLGAKNIDELRVMDAASVALAARDENYTCLGTVDGHVLPRQLVEIFERGEQAAVPLMAGFNRDEASIFPFMIPEVPDTAHAYEEKMHAANRSLAERYLAVYPSGDIKEALREVARDAVYGWPTEKIVRSQTALGLPAYMYFYDHSYAGARAAGLDVFHGSELPLLFGTSDRTPPKWPVMTATPQSDAMSTGLMDYWTSFAADGQPVSSGNAAWQPYGSDRIYMHFAERPIARKHLLPGMFELLDDDVSRRRASGNVAWNWNFGIAAPRALPE